MATYRFRVTFEEYDDVTRDIEIRSTQTFEELHYAIQNAIGFDASKPTSFFLSDDNWKKGKELSTREIIDENDLVTNSRFLDLKSGYSIRLWRVAKNFVKSTYYGCSIAFRKELIDKVLPLPFHFDTT